MFMKVMITSIIFTLFACSALAGTVNINSANAKQIESSLKGIGLSKAIAIVEYREQNGPFQTVDELANVKGIGKKTVERNRQDIKLSTDD